MNETEIDVTLTLTFTQSALARPSSNVDYSPVLSSEKAADINKPTTV
jgi:hypothetical protein